MSAYLSSFPCCGLPFPLPFMSFPYLQNTTFPLAVFQLLLGTYSFQCLTVLRSFLLFPTPFRGFSSSHLLIALTFPFYFSNFFPVLFFFPVVNSPTISFLLFPTPFLDFSSSQWLTVCTFPLYFSNFFPVLFFFPVVNSPTISFLLSNFFPGPFFFPVFNGPYISFLHCIFPTPS